MMRLTLLNLAALLFYASALNAAEPGQATTKATELIPQSQMKVIASVNQADAHKLIDGNPSTSWLIKEAYNLRCPFVSFDLGGAYVVSGVRIQPVVPKDKSDAKLFPDKWQIYVSEDSTDGINGTWYKTFDGALDGFSKDQGETVVTFEPIKATFVRWRSTEDSPRAWLIAPYDASTISDKGFVSKPWLAFSDFNVVKAPASAKPVEHDKQAYIGEAAFWKQVDKALHPNQVPREGLTAYFSWEGNPVSGVADGKKVIDCDLNTGLSVSDKQPHPYVFFDMGKNYLISSLRYQPSTTDPNKDIRKYSIYVCNDFNRETMTGSWEKVTEGTFTQPWPYRGEKTAGFKPVDVRYVKFVGEDPGYKVIVELSIDQYVPDENKELLSVKLKSRLGNAVVMYVDSTTSFVNAKYKPVKKDNFLAKPVFIDGKLFVPAHCLSDDFGAKVELSDDMKTVSINGGTYIPLMAAAKALNKKVFLDERGIIVISGTDAIFDPKADKPLLDELYTARYKGVEMPELDDVIDAPAPADVNKRQDRFSKRNSPERVDELGKSFFAMVDLGKPALAQIKALVNDAKYLEALKEFRDYFMAKLASKRWMWNELTAFEYPNEKGETIADELMYNITTPSARSTLKGKKVNLGNPGRVNWTNDLILDTDGAQSPTSYMLHIDQFYPLIEKYMSSGNSAYLEKFFDFTDDLMLNKDGLDTRYAVNAGYNSDIQSNRGIAYFLRYLDWLTRGMPQEGKEIPETWLARVLMDRIVNYLPVSMVYERNNPQNWSNDIAEYFMAAGILLDDFKVGDFYLNEGIKGIKSYATQTISPDGGEDQMFNHGYNNMYIQTIVNARKLLGKARPDLYEGELKQFLDNQARGKDNFMARCYYGYTGSKPSPAHFEMSPNIYDDPVLGPVYKMVMGIETPAPPYTSEAMPYNGIYNFRTGWDKNNSQWANFRATNGLGGHHGSKSGNEFTLKAYGRDLLATPISGAYIMDESPMTIDKVYQQGRNNSPETNVGLGHKWLGSVFFQQGLNKDNRFLSTEKLGYAYGVYDKGYGAKGKDDITDVTHARMITMLNKFGVWLVGDRVNTPGSHSYEFKWNFPVIADDPKSNAFKKSDIVIDQNTGTIKTNDDKRANLSMYQLASSGIGYFAKTGVTPALHEVSSAISGNGPQAMITVLYPRKTAGDELASVTRVDTGNALVMAADIKLKDGSQVWYGLSSQGKQKISLGGMEANAESLMVMQDKDGNKAGMTVGCEKISLQNATEGCVKPGSFEFKVSGGALQATAYVNPPLELVEIKPGANVFYDKVDVTMQSKDADTEIRYTLNGGYPDLSSPMYTGPVTINKSTGVKARAFRKGVTVMPTDGSLTNASEVAIAYFNKKDIKPALNPQNLVNGMKYKYYEGYWKELITFNDYLNPKKAGITDNVIDISPRETEGYFAFKYQGYIDIPKDGVYTFHAQDEFMIMVEDAGYEMQVFVDGERWNPQTELHGFGTWSIPLAKGMHSFEVQYMDYRSNNARVNINNEGYKAVFINFDRTGTLSADKRRNLPGTKYRDFIWNGSAPKLYISGPGMEKQVVPFSMLYRQQ